MGTVPVVGGVGECLDDLGEGAAFVVVPVADDVDGADRVFVEGDVSAVEEVGEGAHRAQRGGDVRVVLVVGEDAVADAAAAGGGDDRAGGAGRWERPVGVGEQVEELTLGPAVPLQVDGGTAEQEIGRAHV